MATAYFLTAAILSIWAYYQTRTTARSIRVARGTRPCPLCSAAHSGTAPATKE